MGKAFSVGRIIAATLLSCLLAAGCSSGGLTDAPASSGGSSGGSTAVASSLKLSVKPVSVKSDDSDEAMITATALDASNAAVKDLVVTFSADGGKLSSATATTDDKGVASVKFSSGTVDQSNRVVTVTGAASGLTSQVPVSVTGSTLSLATTKTAITDDGVTTAGLTVTAKDAGGNPVYKVPVTLTTGGSGSLSLSAVSGDTDVNGKFTVTVTGTGAGTPTVTAAGLGATATQSYTVSSPAASFGVSLFGATPATDDPYPLTTNTPLVVTVNAPAPTTFVQFATTLGTWDGGASAIVTKPVVGGVATATFNSILAGLATIEVADATVLPVSDTAKKDEARLAVYAPATAAAAMTLQPSASVVAPSTTTLSHTVTLTATVRTSVATGSQIVGSAPVSFTVLNPTGGGETISPVVVYTNAQGVATTTFTSGSLSSGQSQNSVTIQAAVVGAAVMATTTIVIGGTAGSVAIGRGTVVEKLDPATYRLPMSVIVADSNGNAMAGAVVSLSAWPKRYMTGAWYDSDPDPDKDDFVTYVSGAYDNEDSDENMVKSVGEDVNEDGLLTPPNSAAGTLPTTVTTDENGVANFYLTYLKGSSQWIEDRLRASTLVLGTETVSELVFTLPAEIAEAKAGFLPDSPYAMWLPVGAGGTVTRNITSFGTGALYSTGSLYSAIAAGATVAYSFTAPAGAAVGTVYNDTITMTDALNTIGVSVPVRIIVK